MDFSYLSKASSLKEGQVEHVLYIELSKISADPNQPRKEFDEAALKELQDDIEQNGLIQPIVLKENPALKGTYIIVAGERRFRAVQRLGKDTIKAILNNELKKEQVGYIQISENLKRDDLKFYELAEFIVEKQKQGDTQEEIANRLGISQPRVNLFLTWKEAPDFMKEAKKHFKAIRPFSNMVKLSEQYLSEVEEYLNSLDDNEIIGEKDVKTLKEKLEKTEYESVSEEENTVDFQSKPPQIDFETSNDINTPSITENALYDDSDTNVQDETDYESQTFLADEENVQNETEFTDNETEIVQSETDDQEPEEKLKHRYKKPLILGYVDEREATLMYKEIPENDGFLIVKYEDGTIEQILAERFKINRITEA